ncbi:hypothetical protein PH547_05980 [Rhizobium sp. CNPSo 3464]|uniref:hypothetical protein n=1 Tax=Rhizobium sp. CNPSo 3464 TaxID=3021406 RepID=UPI00254E3EB8|nr:hypothetical protein [Rhizobium sp. CNPSo 3464]MDK4738417.1 hypothetical protein [Rhizobium sp. CNPSo 3464]
MSEKDGQRWYWIRISDHESATYAARMSGLPIFLAGLSTAVLALTNGSRNNDPIAVILTVALGLFISAVGWRIRAGSFRVIPIVMPLYLINLAANALLFPIVGSVLAILYILLAIAGIRGWWWLRRNPT